MHLQWFIVLNDSALHSFPSGETTWRETNNLNIKRNVSKSCEYGNYLASMTMMITPNSRTRKGGEQKGEVKGEYDEIQGRRRKMSTTGEWYNSVSNKLQRGFGYKSGVWVQEV